MAEVTLERDEWMRRTGPFYPGLVALCLLSVVPLPRGLAPTRDDVARAAWWFPVVGAGLATSLAALAWFLRAIGLVPGIAAVAVVVAGFVATRGMLERGVASAITRATSGRGNDSSASWLSRLVTRSSLDPGWSESGPVVWSAVAVVGVLALRAGALMGMSASSYTWWAALIVALASARWVPLLVARLVGQATSESALLTSLSDISWPMFGVASGAVGLLALFAGGLAGLAIVLAMAVLVSGAAWLLQSRPGSASDAVISAAACTCEVAVLLAFAAVHPATHSPWVL